MTSPDLGAVLVLWPDGPRYVNEPTIIGWAEDLLADTDPDWDCTQFLDVGEAIELLDNAGLATFGKQEAL